MEVDLLAEGVGAQLRVEPAVDDDRLAACQGGLRRVFHFGAGEQERAYALGIVGDDFLADVIGVAAVAIRFAAEARGLYGVGERNVVALGLDEMREDALVAALGDGEKAVGLGIRQVAATHAFCERVDEHAGGRRFKVVSLFAWLVHHRVPEAGVLVLEARDGGGFAAEDGDQLRAAGVALGIKVERVNEGHHVPAHAARPELR